MELSYTIEIEAPLETVFGLISDIENMSGWMDGLIESEYIEDFDADDPEGTRFRQRATEMGQEVEYEGEIIEYDRPGYFAVRIGNKKFTAEMDYRLTATEGGTRVVYNARLNKASMTFKMLASAFSSTAEKALAKRMRSLKKLAESK